MATTLVSPGIRVREKDLTNVVTSLATNIGGIAIQALKGPVETVTIISSEDDLVEVFGKPTSSTFEYFWTAASFLAYSNTLKVIRVNNSGAAAGDKLMNAVGGTSTQTAIARLLIKSTEHYEDGDGTTGPFLNTAGNSNTYGMWASRTAGTWGNNVKVVECPNATAFQQLGDGTRNTAGTYAVGVTTIVVASGSAYNVDDIIYLQQDDGQHYKLTIVSGNNLTFVRYPEESGTGLTQAVDGSSTAVNVDRMWLYWDQFDGPPGTSTFATDHGASNDEMHIAVYDALGGITGTAGSLLEKYEAVSKAGDAKTDSGDNNYYVERIYKASEYIYWMDHNPNANANWGDAATNGVNYETTSSGDWITSQLGDATVATASTGQDGTTPSEGNLRDAYDKFKDPDTETVSLIMAGPTNGTRVTHLTTLVKNRKDAVAFFSPERSDVVNVTTSYNQLRNVKNFFLDKPSTSYAVFDSGYKKIYDRYSDIFRWVPLNGDIAGLCALTDYVADPWWSPSGLSRGQIRNSVALAFNPTLVERDELYRNRINPVVTFPGEGTMLWGDKTALSQNSAFNRINVRRLFISIEKAIENASKSVLFEFNDEFTRSNFVSIVEPFLDDVKARRGITDFAVICDATNNTPQVIDTNEFRADIYVKPARSINFITLTFIATRTGVSFTEVVGA